MNRRERNLFTNPDLFDDQGVDSVVDSAYLENLGKGRVIQSARQMGEAAIQTSLRNRGVRLPDWRERIEQDVVTILPEKRTEARQELVDAFDNYGNLYQRIGLHMPTPREFVDAGVSMIAQHNHWELQGASNVQPEYVIAPHFDAVNLWSVVFSTLKDNEWNGLYVDETITNKLTDGSDLPRNPRNIPEASVDKQGIRWTLRVISGWTFEAGGQNLIASVSIAEYLAMQAKHIQKGEPPLDLTTSTQLGRPSGRQMIEGYYSREDDRVSIVPYSNARDRNRVLSQRLVH